MGGNLIVTVHQTSGTCDQQVMHQFVQQFLGQMTSAPGVGGATSTGSTGPSLGSASATSTP